MQRVVLVSRSATADVNARAKQLAETHDVELLTVPAPDAEVAARFFTPAHAYSAAVWREIASRFAGDPPARIEFADSCGDALVPVQARITGDAMLAGTEIVAGGPSAHDSPAEPSLEARIDAEIERYVLRHAGSAPPRPRGGEDPLVSVVIPYFRLPEFIERTLESVFAQNYDAIEVLVVNDGSFAPEDEILYELAERHPFELLSKSNGGVGSARNFGIAQARGRYVLPLDADNVIRPGFIERAVGVLEARPEVAYVTSWSTYIDSDDEPLGDELGYQPISNELRVIDELNVAGDALALIRKSVFEDGFRYRENLSSVEDRMLYRELAADQRYGVVIPERLIGYRVRGDSMMRSVDAAERKELLARMDEIIEQGKLPASEDAGTQLRRANVELSRDLVAAHTEIAAIRGSLRWRLLAPFEGLTKRFRGGD